MNAWLLSFGHLHPVLVHLPIGIFLLWAVLELSTLFSARPALGWLPAIDSRLRIFLLACGALSALLTAAAGWLLARGGGYDAALVREHRIFGLLLAAASVALLIAHSGRAWQWVRAPGLIAILVLVFATGHTGGSITHGSDFLVEALPDSARALLPRFLGGSGASGAPRSRVPMDPAHAVAFRDVIQPIFRQECAACHGPTKTKGDLRLDSWKAIALGGKDGTVIKPGDSAASLLFRRVNLDPDDKQHMPPAGKPQLTDDQIAVLGWWIDSGAPETKTLAEMDPSGEIVAAVAALNGSPIAAPPPPDRTAMLAAARRLAAKLGIIIRPLTPDGPWLEVNGHVLLKQFGDQQLAALAPIGPAIERLEVGETSVTDRGLAALAAMTSLRRLNLNRTAVTDAGLHELAPLRNLEELNLFGTAVSDAGLEGLRALPNLRSVYLWQTRVTPSGAASLAAHYAHPLAHKRWLAQIAQIEDKIRADTFQFDLGDMPDAAGVRDLSRPTAAAPFEPRTSAATVSNP
jgi:mono/diheme cytochrome c family protein/uncharacterized membrane protein